MKIHPMAKTTYHIDSLAPGGRGSNFKSIISEYILRIKSISNRWEMVRMWVPHKTFDDKSTLVQVMAWWRQATSHYLKQCWPRFPTPPGPQRVKMWACLRWWLKHHMHVKPWICFDYVKQNPAHATLSATLHWSQPCRPLLPQQPRRLRRR